MSSQSTQRTTELTVFKALLFVLLLNCVSGTSLKSVTRRRTLEDTPAAPATTGAGSSNATSSPSSNTTSPAPPESVKHKLKDELNGAEESLINHKLSHSEVAIAGTFGGLLLASMFGCAGFLLYRRFQAARGSSRKQRSEYYSAEREFGDAAEL